MIPCNEMGVIVVFSQQCNDYGFEIIKIQSAFPDAVVSKNGVIYRVEFEFLSSNFNEHKHDCRGCDLVICWEKDSDLIVPTIALSDGDWWNLGFRIPSDSEKEIAYWKQRAVSAERSLKIGMKAASNAKLGKIDSAVLALAVTGNPKVTNAELAQLFGVSPQAVQKHRAKGKA